MHRCGVRPVSLDDLLRESDYMSLHCPHTPETDHLIGARELSLMKPEAALINAARGQIVDEAALVAALQSGEIAAAALDVLELEPPSADSPLRQMENVILTPHAGGHSSRFPVDQYEAAYEVITGLARGQWPRSVVNPEVSPRWAGLVK